MRLQFVIFLVIITCLTSKAQSSLENVEGLVTFLSSQNTYVKFKTTEGIIIGDTLYSNASGILSPYLVVKNISSTSVVCVNISSRKPVVNEKIIGKRRIESKKPDKLIVLKTDSSNFIKDTASIIRTEMKSDNIQKQSVSGRIAVSNFSNFSNTPANESFVTNYSLLFNVKNIRNSKLSFESNLLYRQENGEWKKVSKNVFNALKIYNFSFKYELDKKSFISIGRKINQNISNIGAVDGLQGEKAFKNIFVGGFLGSRPSYYDYGFDMRLFQFGAYLGHRFQARGKSMLNSMAIVEQTNNMITDRRFFYFQHTNSLIKNISLFYTLELDLYKRLNGIAQNTFSLTNNYLSLRYRMFKKITLSATYDSRKNVIYYETYKDYISAYLASEIRQGYSLQLNYNISRNLFTGVKAGYRLQKSDTRPTKNLYSFVTLSNLLNQSISTTLSATLLETFYLNGTIFNFRINKSNKTGKVNYSFGYSFVNYKIVNAELPLMQNIIDMSFSMELGKKISLSTNFETDFERANKFFRIYLQLRKRF